MTAVLLLAACSDKNTGNTAQDIEIDDIPDMEIKEFRDRYYEGKIKIWVLYSDHASIYEKKKTVVLKSFDFRSYEEGKIHSKITAEHGTVRRSQDDKISEMEARTNVIVESENGDILYTSHLIWDEKRGKVHTSAFVRILKPDGSEIKGRGLEANRDLTDIVIKNRVSGTVYE